MTFSGTDQLSLLEELAGHFDGSSIHDSLWLMYEPRGLKGFGGVLVQESTTTRLWLVPVAIDDLPTHFGSDEAQALTAAARITAAHPAGEGFCVVYTPCRLIPGEENVVVMCHNDDRSIELVVVPAAALTDDDELFASVALRPGDAKLREHLDSAVGHKYKDDSKHNGGLPKCLYKPKWGK